MLVAAKQWIGHIYWYMYFPPLGKTAASKVIWHATKCQPVCSRKYLQSCKDTDTHAVSPWWYPIRKSKATPINVNEILFSFYFGFLCVVSMWNGLNAWMNEWQTDGWPNIISFIWFTLNVEKKLSFVWSLFASFKSNKVKVKRVHFWYKSSFIIH